MSNSRPLAHVHLWLDPVLRSGPENMAYDEAILRAATEPWLRIYSWREPTLSIGFSQALTKIPPSQAHWPVVRRWTGGGVVVHDGDWTYTLAIPTAISLSQDPASDTYRRIHEAFMAALEARGVPGATLQPESVSDGMGVCFIEPARFDVVWQGQKVAGAAQRRTKVGLLHQGSVQGVPIPEGFGLSFAHELAEEVTVEAPDLGSHFQATVADLVAQKYGREEWLQDRKTSVQ